MSVIRIYDVTEACSILLRRAAWEDQEMPPRVLAGIERIFGERLAPAEAVTRILRDVRARGDAALHEWSARIDGPADGSISPLPSQPWGEPTSPLPYQGRGAGGVRFAIPRAAWAAAHDRLPADQRAALELAAGRIATFHRKQPMDSWVDAGLEGTLGQLIRPIERVGVYVPGGTAPLPSSLLMTVIPARVAGVEQVVVCTPPSRSSPGQSTAPSGVADLILAAAHVSGVDHLFALGGAQAIAAMAYGTETVPRVDKIVGAGGLFVTLAKRQVIGAVGIDGFYGPTETLLIADDAADPAWAAADLLAQAEHDVLASPILLTPSRPLAEAVAGRLAAQLAGLSRGEIAAASLAARGGIVLTADLDEAVELANAYAPEHLCLLVRDPWALVGKIRNAGGIFVGEHSCEVLGDYVAGPSHVMPTEGSARYASPLSVADFVKRISLVALTPETGKRLAAPAAVLAQGEGLTAHAAAAKMRSGNSSG
jgi:histidinol dehydrogenase